MPSTPFTPPLDDDDDRLTVLENINPSDETALQRLVDIVNNVIGAEKRSRVSVLSDEQWLGAIEQSEIPVHQRRAAAHYLHALRDPRNPHNLLVSRTAAQGINERMPAMYAEVVYLLVVAAGTGLSTLLQHGTNDIIANICSRQLGVAFFTNNYPVENAFMQGLISCLQRQWGHDLEEWALLLKRDPEQFFLMLRRSQFAGFWVAGAKRNAQLQPFLADLQPAQQRQWLVDMLRDQRLKADSEFVGFTTACIRQYHEYINRKEGQPS